MCDVYSDPHFFPAELSKANIRNPAICTFRDNLLHLSPRPLAFASAQCDSVAMDPSNIIVGDRDILKPLASLKEVLPKLRIFFGEMHPTLIEPRPNEAKLIDCFAGKVMLAIQAVWQEYALGHVRAGG